MTITLIRFLLLIVGAYLLGSVPLSYVVARARGLDLRQVGTNQVGGGNLWRMTSWRIALPVGIFDFLKGAVMVLAAHLVGLGIAQQLVVGAAAIIGHNWPVYLKFHGGRGIATTMGVVTILPFLNGMIPWPPAAAWGILVIGRLVLGSSPLPALIGIASLPIISFALGDTLAVNLAFLAILLIVILKRVTAQPSGEAASVSRRELFLNRLLFDRDVRDRKAWMYRRSEEGPDDRSCQTPHQDRGQRR